MSRFRIVTLALCVLLFFVWGCAGSQRGKEALKGTKSLYYRHVNKPAKLDFDDSNPLKPYQGTLISAISAVDFELEALLRAMDDSDRSPDEEWSRALMERFPWLDGTFMADGAGRVMMRSPYSSSSLLDFSPLFALDPKQRQNALRAAVLDSASGPKVYLAKPVYLEDELRVIIVAHFDIRSLLARRGDPEKFMLLSGKKLLWQAVYDYQETPLYNLDFDKIGTTQVEDIVSNQTGEFYWLASFFANIQFIYATPVKGNFSINPQQMAVLESPRFSARPGEVDLDSFATEISAPYDTAAPVSEAEPSEASEAASPAEGQGAHELDEAVEAIDPYDTAVPVTQPEPSE